MKIVIKYPILLILLAINTHIIGQENDLYGQEQFLEGIVNDSRVRIRKEPNLESENIGYLDRNQIVYILDETTQSMKIGDMNSVWYKIRTIDGVEGWSYGYFIEILFSDNMDDSHDYEKIYDYYELPLTENFIEEAIDLHLDEEKMITRIGYSTSQNEIGTPVFTKYSGKIIDIKWYRDDTRWGKIIGFEGLSNNIQGSGLGFYILMQDDDKYYIYAHLSPDSEQTQYYLGIFENDPDSKALYLSKGIQIGEYGQTGFSLEPNLLVARCFVENIEDQKKKAQ